VVGGAGAAARRASLDAAGALVITDVAALAVALRVQREIAGGGEA
jgi:hypothetical protein